MSTPPIHLDFNSFGFERTKKKLHVPKMYQNNLLKIRKKTHYTICCTSIKQHFQFTSEIHAEGQTRRNLRYVQMSSHYVIFTEFCFFFCSNLWFWFLWRFDCFWIHLSIIEELKHFSKNSYLNCFIVIVIFVMVVNIHYTHINWWIKHCKRDWLF